MSVPASSAIETWFPYRIPSGDATLRLFCFPFAGGSASVFRTWLGALPGVEVMPVQLPGRESRLREAPITYRDRLLDDLTGALYPLLDRPFAFFGHSLGAHIAYQLAARLAEAGRAPRLLAVSAARAPHLLMPEDRLHVLPDAEFLAGVQRYGGMPQALMQAPELLSIFLPILRADFTLLETLGPVAPRRSVFPILATGGQSDPHVSLADLQAWGAHSAHDLSVRQFEGDHFYLGRERDSLLGSLAEALRR